MNFLFGKKKPKPVASDDAVLYNDSKSSLRRNAMAETKNSRMSENIIGS